MRKPHILAAMFCLVAIVASATEARAQGPDSQPSVQPSAAAPQQIKCPVATDEDIDPEVYTDYHGNRVYFCCERCKKNFECDPESYVLNLAANQIPPQPAPDAAAKTGDHEARHDGDPDAYTDHTIAPGAHGPDEHADHEHHHGGSGSILNWLGNFHPPMTNFPIGVLVAAAVAELLFMWRKAPHFDHAARFGVWFAAMTGLGAAFLGWCFGGFRLVDI